MPGDTLTIFSSLPLQGAHADQAQSIVNAQKLALREAGGRVGDFKINFASADDATAGGDRVGWDPDKTAENARKAVENTRTIAYIGDFDSGATAISLPITNEAGFVQVSPASTAVGLTKFAARRRGGGARQVLSLRRPHLRARRARRRRAGLGGGALDPQPRRPHACSCSATSPSRATASWSCTWRRPGGRACGSWAQDRMDPRDEDYRRPRARDRRTRPDAVYFGGGADQQLGALWRDLHEAMPEAC